MPPQATGPRARRQFEFPDSRTKFQTKEEEANLFIDNNLTRFSAQEAGAVFFGPQANYNLFSGDPGAGIIDLGFGNVVEKSP